MKIPAVDVVDEEEQIEGCPRFVIFGWRALIFKGQKTSTPLLQCGAEARFYTPDLCPSSFSVLTDGQKGILMTWLC